MMWQNQLKSSRREATWLLDYVGLTQEDVEIDLSPEFKVFVPPRWVQKMTHNNARDPLLLQVLSLAEEMLEQPLAQLDPLEEGAVAVCEGLLHKYDHRVLVVTSGACPIHCRYCFRRHFPYQKHTLSESVWQNIVTYLSGRSDVYEVILSGGDPLMLSDHRIERILSDLARLPNIRRIRFHTRFATTIPQRFNEDFWTMIAPFSQRIIWVWHVNHAQELGDDVKVIAQRAMRLGMRVLSQSVLLKNINDNLHSLQELMWALDDTGVQPYYMHQMDRVRGAMHYEVELALGLSLMASLQKSMPGYLVPKYVKEIPGERSKTILTKDFINILV